MRVLLTSLTFSKREFPGVVKEKTAASRCSRSPELRVWGRWKGRNWGGGHLPLTLLPWAGWDTDGRRDGCSKPVHLAGQVWETLSPLPEPQANEGRTVCGGPLGWPEVPHIPAASVPKGRGRQGLGGKPCSRTAGLRGPAQPRRRGRSVHVTARRDTGCLAVA